MARQTRKECSTNIYHVGLKGENSQTVFFDDEDRVQFLQTLSYSSEKYESGVAAWVLMSNHIHLLLHGKLENFTPMFKSIGASYTKWANTKYKRDGSLWGGRFYSQGVVTENEYALVAAYIFNNPVAAHIVAKPENYEWSNFNGVCKGIDKNAISLINSFSSVEHVVKATNANAKNPLSKREERDIEVFPMPRLTDDELISHIQKRISNNNPMSVADLPEQVQKQLAEELFEDGATVAQISRVTGISRRKLSYF